MALRMFEPEMEPFCHQNFKSTRFISKLIYLRTCKAKNETISDKDIIFHFDINRKSGLYMFPVFTDVMSFGGRSGNFRKFLSSTRLKCDLQARRVSGRSDGFFKKVSRVWTKINASITCDSKGLSNNEDLWCSLDVKCFPIFDEGQALRNASFAYM